MNKFEFDGPVTLEDHVYQAIGAASMAWSETPKGIFDGDYAKSIAEALIEKIEEMKVSN